LYIHTNHYIKKTEIYLKSYIYILFLLIRQLANQSRRSYTRNNSDYGRYNIRDIHETCYFHRFVYFSRNTPRDCDKKSNGYADESCHYEEPPINSTPLVY